MAGKPCFDIPKLWPTTLINQPAGVKSAGEDFLVLNDLFQKWLWLRTNQNKNKKREATLRFSLRAALFPFVNTGPAGGDESSVESGIEKAVCASADSREDDDNVNSLNKLLCKGSIQLPDWELPLSVSSCTDCTFISSHNPSETWAAGFLSSLAQIALIYIHRDRLSICVVSPLSSRGRWGRQWLIKWPVFFFI